MKNLLVTKKHITGVDDVGFSRFLFFFLFLFLLFMRTWQVEW